jgi:hypothetical protein
MPDFSAMRPAVVGALLLATFSFTAQAAGLPDTGQDTCYTDTAADGVSASDPSSIARDGGSYPRQDCRYGRDPAAAAGATKTGGGAKGFDYTKIANDGTALPASAALGSNPTDWACTQDNITRLMWEVKTTSGLRDAAYRYSWYNSTGSTNAGNAGYGVFYSPNTCQTFLRCDTEKFVADVNSLTGASRLCAATDWRMPTLRELLTLSLLDGTNPSIDPTYFPNTSMGYWSASSYVLDPVYAWVVYFNTGSTSLAGDKLDPNYVRLVRGGQF